MWDVCPFAKLFQSSFFRTHFPLCRDSFHQETPHGRDSDLLTDFQDEAEATIFYP